MVDPQRVAFRFMVATEHSLSPEMEKSVEILGNFFKGSKKAKFLASIDAIKASLQHGSWIPRGAIKAKSGFTQGLISYKTDFRVESGAHADYTDLKMCLHYGMPYQGNAIPTVEGVSEHVIVAWIQATREFKRLSKLLTEARPKPVVTQVGLSPKVTKTLMEMDLQIDLSTVREADLVKKERQDVDKHGNPRFTSTGEPVMIAFYVVKWTPGIKLHMSRFSHGDGCEACGKAIPSGRFVPIEALCTKNGLVGLWVGVDCAKNIFGIKDQGIERSG